MSIRIMFGVVMCGVVGVTSAVVGARHSATVNDAYKAVTGGENPPPTQTQPTTPTPPLPSDPRPSMNDLRETTAKKMKDAEGQFPIIRAHVQTLEAREVAVKYAVYSANEMITEQKWPCTWYGRRIETRGDAYRALIVFEDKHKKIKAELARFAAAQSALLRVREDLEDKMRTLDLVDTHNTVIDAADFVRNIEKIKVPALPSEPTTIDLPTFDLTAVK